MVTPLFLSPLPGPRAITVETSKTVIMINVTTIAIMILKRENLNKIDNRKKKSQGTLIPWIKRRKNTGAPAAGWELTVLPLFTTTNGS